MHKQIYVNLPVSDLERSKRFFAALGYRFDPNFTNESAAGMQLGENLYCMLLVQPFFAGFTPKPIADAHASTEVLIALPCESRAAVDELVAKAREAGASIPREPVDHGFMYQHGYEDPDGHIWEVFWMDAAAAQA
ncbi:extradiol dioxygenase [beta proteobacterium AAP99]|nr:extradiol dioxygenase [beta proteobacterium AAP99]